MKKIIILFGLIIVMTDALACECIPIMTLKQHYDESEIVFYAKVIAINDKKINGFHDTMHFRMDSVYTDRGGYHPQLKIIKTIKGKFKSDILEKDILNYQSLWGLCDIFFKRDSEYIVFGNFDENGKFQTSICSATTLVTDKKLLRQLKKMR